MYACELMDAFSEQSTGDPCMDQLTQVNSNRGITPRLTRFRPRVLLGLVLEALAGANVPCQYRR